MIINNMSKESKSRMFLLSAAIGNGATEWRMDEDNGFLYGYMSPEDREKYAIEFMVYWIGWDNEANEPAVFEHTVYEGRESKGSFSSTLLSELCA